MLCIQSVGISSCLPFCCTAISFSVYLCSFSQKRLVLAISHICGCVLASSSGQTTLQESSKRILVRLLPGVFISDVAQSGLTSCPSQQVTRLTHPKHRCEINSSCSPDGTTCNCCWTVNMSKSPYLLNNRTIFIKKIKIINDT